MSFEEDARDCLIEAIRRSNHVVLRPEDLNDNAPEDEGFDHTEVSWMLVLENAASCLRNKGHTVAKPTRIEARRLVGEKFVASLVYLEDLVTERAAIASTDPKSGLLVAAGLTAAVVAVVAVTAARGRSRQRRRP